MLNSIKITYLDRCIELAVLVLMAIGTVFVFSAGANVSNTWNLHNFYSFTTLKQLLFFPLAVTVMYITSRIDYHRFGFCKFGLAGSLTPYLLALSIALLILVLIPGIGIERNFSRRWLDLAPGGGYLSFQPSELAKWALVFFLAAFADKFSNTMKLYWKRFVPPSLIAGLIAALIVTQDFGTAAFITLLAFLMLLIAGAHWWHFLTPLPVVLPAFYFAVVTSPTRINRIKDFFNPDVMSYQANQSLIAISSGGIWGKGLGRGISKYGHLPEDTTDFIFAIIAEELGFVGAVFVVAVFVALIVLTILLVLRCNDRFGRMLSAGIMLTIAAQAAINIGVVTVVLPTKGIPLPFISAGGTSMLLSAAAAGVLLNIARQTSRTSVETEEI